QEQRQEGVVEEVDEVVEPAAVEIGQDLLDADGAGQGAVGGVDQGGGQHQGEGPAEGVAGGADGEDGDGGGGGQAPAGVAVHAPGQGGAQPAEAAAGPRRAEVGMGARRSHGRLASGGAGTGATAF